MDDLNKVENRLKIYFLSILFSLSLGSLYFYHRIGTEDLLLYDLVKSISFLILILILPDFISKLRATNNNLSCWATITKIRVILIVTLSSIGILISQSSLVVPFFVWPSTLVLLLFWMIKAYLKELKLFLNLKTVAFVLLCTLSFLMIGELFWSSTYHTFFPELVLNGPMDTYYHAAISNLIKTYHTVTTGLHDVPVLKYHVGSHVLFAGVSSLLNIKSILFYNLSYAVIFIPLYFNFLLTFIRSTSNYFSTKFNFKISTLIVLIVHLGVFPYLFSVHPFVSESSFVSIIIIITFIIALIDLFDNYAKINNVVTVVKLLYLVALFMFASLTKFSSGFFLLLVLIYVVFRVKSIAGSTKVLMSAIFGIALFITYSLWISNLETYEYDLMLPSLNNYMNLSLEAKIELIMKIDFIYPVTYHFIFILTTIVIILRRYGFKVKGRVKFFLKGYKFVLLEALLFSFVVLYFIDFSLLITGSVVNDSDDYFYFNFPPFVISIFLFLGIISTEFPKIKQQFIYLSCILLIIGLSYNIHKSYYMPYKAKLKIELKEDHIRKFERKEIIKVLTGIGELSNKEKRESILYIPKTNQYFWKENKDWLGWDVSNRSKMPFLPGAFSGLAQLNSFPKDTFVWSYSFNTYEIDMNYSEEKAKVDAFKMGYKTLFILNEDNGLKLDTLNLIQN
tara:strand:- start:507 stop:2540 length:2034 start_codon:yes stop_codon:yes gene_type:complete